jgi:hypothetical protein
MSPNPRCIADRLALDFSSGLLYLLQRLSNLLGSLRVGGPDPVVDDGVQCLHVHWSVS